MQIKWKGYCHKCHAPLDIKILAGDSQELLGLATFLEYYPHPDFNKNQSIYKFCGIKAHKVCAQCYVNLGKMKKYYCSRNREIGGKPPVLYEPSLTQVTCFQSFGVNERPVVSKMLVLAPAQADIDVPPSQKFKLST